MYATIIHFDTNIAFFHSFVNYSPIAWAFSTKRKRIIKNLSIIDENFEGKVIKWKSFSKSVKKSTIKIKQKNRYFQSSYLNGDCLYCVVILIFVRFRDYESFASLLYFIRNSPTQLKVFDWFCSIFRPVIMFSRYMILPKVSH